MFSLSSPFGRGLSAVGLITLLTAASASAQTGLAAECVASAEPARGECMLAVASMRAVHERVGVALWGGNPVPGTASTVGLRIGSTPRVSVAGAIRLVPAALPPLPDRTTTRSERTMIPAFSTHVAVGMLPGWSPLPTVGGVLSVDLVGGLSVASLPGGAGFDTGGALGWSAGVRLGALRESFTLPGVSLTASYGRSTSVAYGDPTDPFAGGFTEGAMSDLNATLAASRRIAGLRFTAGVATDRYSTRGRIGYRPDPGGAQVVRRGRVTTDRRSWFANAEWTSLVFHASAEAGWQSIPTPDGLPADVRLDPVGWWLGLAFRLSI